MKFISAVSLLLLFPALSLNTRQGYEDLERKLKEVFMERSGILRQLSKTSKELDGIKGNLQSLKNDEAVTKKDVQRILALSQKQREEMKSFQEALQKQLNEAAEKAEKQQATINFLKAEMERKTKIIKDLQQENKSLKNKLLSGSKLCGIHAEESKKIQAQLKELRYGKKDLIFKGQQLTDLELKLTAAKKELEKAALDKESQLKALKETVHLCLSSVLHNQPPTANRIPSKPSERLTSPLTNSSGVLFQQPHTKDISLPWKSEASKTGTTNGEPVKKGNRGLPECHPPNAGKYCSQNQTEQGSLEKKAVQLNLYDQQKALDPSWEKADVLKSVEDSKKILENEDNKMEAKGI
ncbi:leucine zipper protein 2-like isoform X1 [Polyodon spathula]|uniref:leucine zipper protein 2-like isoform X1 n=1 Tax=Polyodon spathula TaxID=7913 RepID=UPI001B7DE720|nr:leucine zipper protein 2-like isoform X1 [Polyodon spathula]